MNKLEIFLVRIFKLVISLFLILLGLGVFLNPTPMPGTDRQTSAVIGLVLIGIGGALYKIIGIQAEARIRAREWKKVLKEG